MRENNVTQSNVKHTKTDIIKRGDSGNLRHILSPSELLQNKA